MSFWSSVQRSVDSVVASATHSYTNLTSYPEEVQCKDCHVTTRIPATTFEWQCIHGHVCPPTANDCPSCNTTKSEAKSKGLYKPSVHCSGCQIVLELSETTIANNFWSALYATPHNIEQAYNSAKHEVKELANPPETFSCRHCHVLLYTPMGPWVCSFENCSTQNDEHTYACKTCNSGRYIMGVICSICSRATPIPGTKFQAQLEQGLSNASNFAQTGYRYAAGQTVSKCSTCQFPIAIEKEQARLIFGLGPNDPVPGFDGEKIAQKDSSDALPNGEKMTQGEEDILTSLNKKEEEPLAAAQPTDDKAALNPIPQDILCTKCLHLNTVSKEQLVSRKLPTQPAQPVPQTPEQQANSYTMGPAEQTLKHVDHEGNPIRCIHCSVSSSVIKPVVPCATCRCNFCRKCAPYTRTLSTRAQLFCFECAKVYDADVMKTQHKSEHDDIAASSAPTQLQTEQVAAEVAVDAKVATPPAPIEDPYETL